MKKLLYTTSALVGAAFLMEAVVPAKAEVNMSLRYRAALISQAKKDEDKVKSIEAAKDDDSTKAITENQKDRTTSLNSAKIDIGISASKDHPNGLTTSATLAVTTSGKKLDYNDAFGSISGSFGKVDIGDFHDIGYRAMSSGVPGTSNFGAVDAGFQPAGVAIVTPATGNVGGRASGIAYWSPSFSGAQVGVSWHPQVSKEGKEASLTSTHGDLEDSMGFAATYSNDFGGTGVSLGVSFEAADQVSAKAANLGGGSVATGTAATNAAAAAHAKALEGIANNGFQDGTIYLVNKKDMTLALPSHANVAGSNAGTGGIGGIADAKGSNKFGDLEITSKVQDASAFSGFVSFDIGQFSVGGSYGAWEKPNPASTNVISESTAYALGAGYSVDAFTFGVGYAIQSDDNIYNNIRVSEGDTYTTGGGFFDADPDDSTKRAAISGGATEAEIEASSAYKATLDKNILAFTAGYNLGDGAALDFVIEQSEAEELTINADDKLTKRSVKSSGFGIGIDLKF